MKLILLKLNGYRRFSDEQRLKLDGRIVALLGPNEAGKTSILKALESLNNKEPLKMEGDSLIPPAAILIQQIT